MLCHLYSAPKSSLGFLADALASMIKLNCDFAPCPPRRTGSRTRVTDLILPRHSLVATLLGAGGHLCCFASLFAFSVMHTCSRLCWLPGCKHSSLLFRKLALFWCTSRFLCEVCWSSRTTQLEPANLQCGRREKQLGQTHSSEKMQTKLRMHLQLEGLSVST